MTRVKKTRSLKRIHQVKTGSVSKLKREARAAGHDRQGSKKSKDRTPSVYEKFLQEHPEAREKPAPQPEQLVKKAHETSQEAEKKEDRNKSLLDLLDSKGFDDDIY